MASKTTRYYKLLFDRNIIVVQGVIESYSIRKINPQ